jgi:hypothetical protein
MNGYRHTEASEREDRTEYADQEPVTRSIVRTCVPIFARRVELMLVVFATARMLQSRFREGSVHARRLAL